MIARGLRFFRVAALALVVAGCSSGIEDHSILGRWHAERVKFNGVSLPIGPEILITGREVVALDTDVHIAIESFTGKMGPRGKWGQVSNINPLVTRLDCIEASNSTAHHFWRRQALNFNHPASPAKPGPRATPATAPARRR